MISEWRRHTRETRKRNLDGRKALGPSWRDDDEYPDFLSYAAAHRPAPQAPTYPRAPYGAEPPENSYNDLMLARANSLKNYQPWAQSQMLQGNFGFITNYPGGGPAPSGYAIPGQDVRINPDPVYRPFWESLLRHEYTHFFDQGMSSSAAFQAAARQTQEYQQYPNYMTMLEQDKPHLYTFFQQMSPRNIPTDLRQFYQFYSAEAYRDPNFEQVYRTPGGTARK